MKISTLALYLLTLLLLAMPPLCAQNANHSERILSFHSDITVRADASMRVAETIIVYAAHININHGIYRDFPTSYQDILGKSYNVHFKVVSVSRNGAPEPYHTESSDNSTRVYMGSKDRLVATGKQSYTLTYEVNNVLGFFPDHDELYWNVTGNGWDFPIEKASATVKLPAGITKKRIKVEGYTGALGAKGQAYKASVDAATRAQFVTTKSLALHEGLTIVVSFPKGYVKQPKTR